MFNFLKRKVPEEKTTQVSEQQERTLTQGLARTREGFFSSIARLFSSKRSIDQQLLTEFEETLLMADIGVDATKQIINNLVASAKKEKAIDASVLQRLLKTQLSEILSPCVNPFKALEGTRPYVVLVVGVNGSGKTTTIGKLAQKLQKEGSRVMLAAGDTFRAAAIEQLKIWGERNHIEVIAQKQGSDSAAVLYDALQAARAREIDVLIADTAGRLHTQNNLMAELAKAKRILQKIDSTAPHETLLVLDATTGQNALNQAKQFNDAVGVSGICLTKLDGTAKGGIIFAIAQSTKIPIRFVGVGEQIDDLKDFDANEFIEALFL